MQYSQENPLHGSNTCRLNGSPSRVFYASYPDDDALNQAQLDRVEVIQRVVAYAPGVIEGTICKLMMKIGKGGLRGGLVHLRARLVHGVACLDYAATLDLLGPLARPFRANPASVPRLQFPVLYFSTAHVYFTPTFELALLS